MKKKILIFSLIALLLLGGACAQAPAQKYEYITEDSTGYAGVPELPRESLLMDEALEGYELGSSTQERLVIKTANMRVSVVDPVEAMWSVSQMATQLGGYVISSESSSSVNSSGEYKTASISIRIPTQKLDVAMEKFVNCRLMAKMVFCQNRRLVKMLHRIMWIPSLACAILKLLKSS